MLRIGLGYDLHKLAPGLSLWIGGVEIPSSYGCVAHSDGDVLVHALVDALVGPFDHTDIGSLFPDNDSRYRGVKSLDLLVEVRERFFRDIRIHNIDAVVILDKPRLMPYRDRIRENLASVLRVDPEVIHLKAKTSESTAIDEISCYVVALIEKL